MRRRRFRRFPSSTKQPPSASRLPGGRRPPLPAAELPLIPEVTETPKVPFWKKEISLGGKKGDPKPKPQKEKKGRRRKGSEEAPAVDEAPTVSDPAPEKSSIRRSPQPSCRRFRTRPEKVPFWKKEIGGKKSDRKPKEKKERKPKAAKEERAAKAKEPKQPKERKQKVPKVKAVRGVKGAKGITGLKIGASQLAAARVSNNGSAELLQVAREPLDAGDRRRRRAARSGRACRGAEEFFAKNGLPKRGVRLGLANNRIGVRTFEISGITTRSSSETRSASAPRRRCRSRSTRRCSTTRCSARESTRRASRLAASCSSSPIAS